MPLPTEIIHRYVATTGQVDLTDERAARVTAACEAVADALRAVVDGSLFDTEPGQLQTVLDELADESLTGGNR